ncbi:hypothetical protein HOP50_06g40840 [Chloropicon primus]|uniref:Armadillo repeat domain-containing protein n=2 Tax=Chloropicon primus TaxID=1764295 RepID=A0A5B8MM82_9CHLO|nr:hypothetical protein A3770_06p40750 [Chloropicon primus]UPR00768.1 hypothetical protein HOP50_06g40840 [Chloropicon primus]|eukprot:QDZ21557.1 hypothetical protein A3770_06p40750 [Chloropicon primus]
MKRITQEEFDDAVDEMVEGLGLEPNEAVQAAIEEYDIQGVSLEGIIKQVKGAQVLANMPTANMATELKRVLEREDQDKDVREGVQGLKEELLRALEEDDEGKKAQLFLASAKKGSVESLFAVCDRAEAESDRQLLSLALGTLKLQLESDHARDHFVEGKGPRRMMMKLEECGKDDATPEDVALLDLLLEVSAISMKEQEEGKCNFMSDGLPKLLAANLGRYGDKGTHSKTNVEACCSCIKGILTADDTRPTPLALEAQFGGEFMKALSMDKDGVTSALMSCFEVNMHAKEIEEPARRDVMRSLAIAMRKIALNDEICKKFVEEKPNCIPMLLSVLRSSAGSAAAKSKDVAMSVLMLLKQISACDTVKKKLIESEAIEMAIEIFEGHDKENNLTASSTTVIQSLLYILTNIALRNPDVAEHFADCGGFDFVFEFIAKYLDKPKLMKQCCMLLRNCAVRSAKVKALLLKAGMEKQVRAIQEQHQKICNDVAIAALRDMGVENYN